MFANDFIFWRKNSLFRGTAMKQYRQAIKNQSLARAEIEQINWEKRKQLVRHAYDNSRFYAQFYGDHGICPDDLKEPDDWLRIPVLEKEHLRNYGSKILINNAAASRLIKTTTGGSTGIPVKTYRDKHFPEEVLKWRMLARWGVSPAADKLMLWRIPENKSGYFSKLINSVIWFPTTRYKFDSSSLNKTDLDKITNILLCHRPPVIWGYVGALEEVALYLEEIDAHLDYEPLVWATAAPLSGIQIALFNKVFGRRVLDQYACSEIHWIASNTPNSRNLVVEHDFRNIDVVDQDNQPCPPGHEGHLLITDLENRVYPLIRYRNGDIAGLIPHGEACQYPFPQITPVKGRISDVVRSPSGIAVPGEYLTTIFDDCTDYVKQFTVIQKSDFSIVVQVKTVAQEDAFRKNGMTLIMNKKKVLEAKLNNEVNIDFEFVDHIHNDRGKTRFVRSELTSPENAVH